MTRKRYQELIEYRLDFLNKKLGTNYKISYRPQYGWDMYEIVGTSGQSTGKLGFDYRKSNAEMLNYLDGIMNVLTYYKVTI